MDIIGIVILAALALYAIVTYNGLVKARQMVREAWSGIDVQLKRRADLIPNIVNTVKGYADHEQETLQKVTEMRTRAQSVPADDVAGRAAVEGMLSQALGRLMAVAEAYPDLKANESFQHLQTRITNLENSIADRREFYNASVNANNVRIEQFPDVIIARLMSFKPASLLEFTSAETADVNLAGLFS